MVYLNVVSYLSADIYLFIIYLRTNTSGKEHCITNLCPHQRGQNHLPGHEPIIHRLQVWNFF